MKEKWDSILLERELTSSSFEHFPAMNQLLKEQLVGRTVVDLLIEKNSTMIALDNGAILEVPGFSFEFLGNRRSAAAKA